MNIAEILYQMKKKSLKELVPVSTVRTDADVEKLSKEYIVIPYANLKKGLGDMPKKYISHLYYQKNVRILLYYDPEKLHFFPTMCYVNENRVETGLIPKNESPKKFIKCCIKYIEASKANGFHSALMMVPEGFRIEYILRFSDRIPKDKLYKLFMEFYQHQEYISDDITDEMLQAVYKAKKNKQKRKTEKKLLNFPDELTVYRGVGNKSLKTGYSYTLSPDIARFFACRHSANADEVRIIKGKIKKKDVIEYLTDAHEQEIMAYPNMVYDKEEIVLNGIARVLQDTDYDHVNSIYADYFQLPIRVGKALNLDFSSGHAVHHMQRVLLLSILLAERYELPKEYRDTLFTAAALHDIGRTNDQEDEEHGRTSYKRLLTYDKWFENPLLENLMTYHCIDDSKAKEVFQDEEEKLAFSILKDADALDRQRFGIMELDSSYLRLQYSKQLVFAAIQLCDGIS